MVIFYPADRRPFWHRGFYCFWDGDVLTCVVAQNPETVGKMDLAELLEEIDLNDYEVGEDED